MTFKNLDMPIIKQGIIERKMIDKVKVAVILNEKQATVMFPTLKARLT